MQQQISLKQRAATALAEIVQLAANDIDPNPEKLSRAVQYIVDAAVTETFDRFSLHVLLPSGDPEYPVEVWAHTLRHKTYIESYISLEAALAEFPAAIDLVTVAQRG